MLQSFLYALFVTDGYPYLQSLRWTPTGLDKRMPCRSPVCRVCVFFFKVLPWDGVLTWRGLGWVIAVVPCDLGSMLAILFFALPGFPDTWLHYMPSNLGVCCDQTLQNWKQFSCNMNIAIATVSKDLGSMPLLHRFSEKYSSMKNHGVGIYIKKLHFWYQRVKNGSCKDWTEGQTSKGRVQDMDCLLVVIGGCWWWWWWWWSLVVVIVVVKNHLCCHMGVFLWAFFHIFYLIHIYVFHTGKTHAHTHTRTRPGCHFVECSFSFKIAFSNFPGLNNQQQTQLQHVILRCVSLRLPGSFTQPAGYTQSHQLLSNVVGERSSPAQKDQVPRLAGFCSGIPKMSAKTARSQLQKVGSRQVPTANIFFCWKFREVKQKTNRSTTGKNQEDETDNAFVEKTCIMHHAFRFQMLMCFLVCYLQCLFFGFQGDRNMASKMKSPLGHVSNETNQGVV